MLPISLTSCARKLKDAEFVSETVVINRLYHRELIARMSSIEELEKKWNCKIDFPSTEMASDVVTISGPEYQVPQARDEFLVCPPLPPCNGHSLRIICNG